MDADLLERARRSLRRRDPRLGAVIRQVGPCGIQRRGDPYGALLRSILYQQLAGAAARAIEGRFKAAFGGRYPAPKTLLAARAPRLRKLGLSRQKIAAMKNVARAVEEGRVRPRRLYHQDDETVVEVLTRIHGIGEWTAHMILMFSLGRPDVLPVGDYGIRKGAQRVYGLRELPRPAELESLAEPWRPYRSVASWYLWRALELETPG
ncbi:MAG: DNA-3-methyladenine glycosylase 2 family protein [Proteobacteria bacterium]|nr:DNA-3-methyladenine glycosylase 2 family protein [Pseudomonadota bacterium]